MMRVFAVKLGALLITAMVEITAFAEATPPPAAAAGSSTETTQATPTKKWAVALSLTGSGDLKDIEQGSSLSMSGIFGYSWIPGLKTSVRLDFNQDFTPETKATISDFMLTQSWLAPLLPYEIKPVLSLRLYAPASQASQDAGLILGARLRADLSKTWINHITFAPYASVRGNILRYETAQNQSPKESPNTLFNIAGGSMLSVTYWKLRLMTDWSVIRSHTTQDSIRYNYVNDTSLAFALNDNVEFAVGFSNDAPTARNGGLDSNVTLFDVERSTLYGSTSVSF